MKAAQEIEIKNYKEAKLNKLDKVIEREKGLNIDESGAKFELAKSFKQSHSRTALRGEIKLIKFCIEQIGRNLHFLLWM